MNTVLSTSTMPSVNLNDNTGLLIASFNSKRTHVEFDGDYETAVEFHNTRIEDTSFDIEMSLYGKLKVRVSKQQMETEVLYTYLENNGEVGCIGTKKHEATYHVSVIGSYGCDYSYDMDLEYDIGWCSDNYCKSDDVKPAWEHINNLSVNHGDEISIPLPRKLIDEIFKFAFDRWMWFRLEEEK